MEARVVLQTHVQTQPPSWRDLLIFLSCDAGEIIHDARSEAHAALRTVDA